MECTIVVTNNIERTVWDTYQSDDSGSDCIPETWNQRLAQIRHQ